MIRNDSRVYRVTDVRLAGESSLCIEQHVLAEVRDKRLWLADRYWKLLPVTIGEFLADPRLRDAEKDRLLRIKKRWTLQLADRIEDEATFAHAIPIPPISHFKSRNRSQSPVGNFMRWLDQQAGLSMHPNDVLIHSADLAELRQELRGWLSFLGARGEELRRAVNLHDLGGAPREARRGLLPKGWICFRKHRRGA